MFLFSIVFSACNNYHVFIETACGSVTLWHLFKGVRHFVVDDCAPTFRCTGISEIMPLLLNPKAFLGLFFCDNL